MYKNLRWKFLTILAVTVLAVAAFWPPSTRVKRGLDLQGGLHLVMRVQTDEAVKIETETSLDQLKEALKTANVAITGGHATGLTSFVVEGVPAVGDSVFKTQADQQVGLNFNFSKQAADTYSFTMKPNYERQLRDGAVAQSIHTIDQRTNELGVSEPLIAPYGSAGDEIIVELPGQVDIERAKLLIGQVALLELKLVESSAGDEKTLLAPYNGVKPPDMDVVAGASASRKDATMMFYLVKHTPVITGRDLNNARPGLDQYNAPNVHFTLKSQGGEKFAAATAANIGKQLAIILDNHVVSAPSINSTIRTEGEITGTFTQQEAGDLSMVLRTGALPAPLTYEDQLAIGPTLGADSIRAGILASAIGLGLVTAFMLFYYRLAGINAFVSVVLNLVILMGFMAYMGAVMTLPGIAGFILTIGMGVDSNVLIFERIREELHANKGVRQALAAGFDRVFITIVDTHVSSLISAAFLFQFGSGPIRGFATTLFFGLIANVFTAVFVSRTLFEFILSRKPAGAVKLSI